MGWFKKIFKNRKSSKESKPPQPEPEPDEHEEEDDDDDEDDNDEDDHHEEKEEHDNHRHEHELQPSTSYNPSGGYSYGYQGDVMNGGQFNIFGNDILNPGNSSYYSNPPNSSYEYSTSGYGYPDDGANRQQYTTFPNDTWDQEHWGHHQNPPQYNLERSTFAGFGDYIFGRDYSSHYSNPSQFDNQYYTSGYDYQDEARNGDQMTALEKYLWGPSSYYANPLKFYASGYNTLWREQGRSISETSYGEQCRHQLRCYVCDNLVPSDEHGQPDYIVHPFWQQPYCPSHLGDGTLACSCCFRLKSRDASHLSLNDGRKICSECYETAIMDPNECQQLHREVEEFYKSLGMEVEQRIPVLLVDEYEIERAYYEGEEENWDICEIRGLCTGRELAINTIPEKPRIIGDDVEIITEPYDLTSDVEIKGILILYGYPRLLTGSILVHEMMHAWHRLKGCPRPSDEVEEGICEVMAHMWLCSKINSSQDHGEKRLAEFFKYLIETNPAPNYGSGFWKGHEAVKKHGLKCTLDHIRTTGEFLP